MRKLITVALATIFAFTSFATSADEPNAFVEIQANEGAGLSATIDSANFGTLRHSFDTQTIQDKSLIITVSDTRGTGDGWNVTVSGTDFKTEDGSKSFGINNLALQSPQVQTVKGQDYNSHSFEVRDLHSIQSDSQNNKIASAQQGKGIGEYKLTHPATLTIPGGTLIGSYQSTLTVSIATGP